MTSLGFGASLALRHCRAATAGFDFVSALPAGATLTRGSAATQFDATGRLVSMAANAARFDYDPVALTAGGLLIEAAASNLCLSSEAFDAAAWPNFGSTATANAAASPAATVTADKLAETSSTGQHRTQQVIATTSGQGYGLSLFVKAAERSAILLRLIATTTYAAATFDVAAQAIGGVTGSAAIVPLADGWFRLAVSGVANGTSTTAYLSLLDATGASSYTGAVGLGLLLWGAQIEAGPVSSYIATTSAVAARSADAVTLNWGGFGVPDGTPTVRYTFDDGSTQDLVTTIAGGTAAVPTTLARTRMRRAAIV